MIIYKYNDQGVISTKIKYNGVAPLVNTAPNEYLLESTEDVITRDYLVVDNTLVERQPMTVDVPKNTIQVNEELVISIEPSTYVTISGPGLSYQELVQDGSITFSSEWTGSYSFILTNATSKRYNFRVEVE